MIDWQPRVGGVSEGLGGGMGREEDMKPKIMMSSRLFSCAQNVPAALESNYDLA